MSCSSAPSHFLAAFAAMMPERTETAVIAATAPARFKNFATFLRPLPADARVSPPAETELPAARAGTTVLVRTSSSALKALASPARPDKHAPVSNKNQNIKMPHGSEAVGRCCYLSIISERHTEFLDKIHRLGTLGEIQDADLQIGRCSGNVLEQFHFQIILILAVYNKCI